MKYYANKKYKSSSGDVESAPDELSDVIMILLWLGCKLSSRLSEKAASKVVKILEIISQGREASHDHQEFLLQYAGHKFVQLRALRGKLSSQSQDE